MAIIGTFKGASSIIAFPEAPGIKSLELSFHDTVAISQSPFTGTTQTQLWPGADWWEASVALPQMVQSDAQVWTAWLMELRGMSNVFFLGDPNHAQPTGNPKGTPTISGVNNAMATTLQTRGWKPSTSFLLMPGDQLQIGNRLHRALNIVSSDANGNAAISIWPSLREATADGDPIILNKPQGLWRLADNARSVLTDETLLSGISFKIREAR